MSRTDFFDTNVLLYLVSGESDFADRAQRLLADRGVISVQVLNEFCYVAKRKFRVSLPDARRVLVRVRRFCEVMPLDIETHDLGIDIAERYRLGVYDGMILAAARRAGCTSVLTEDLNAGQVIEGVTISNPFLSSS